MHVVKRWEHCCVHNTLRNLSFKGSGYKVCNGGKKKQKNKEEEEKKNGTNEKTKYINLEYFFSSNSLTCNFYFLACPGRTICNMYINPNLLPMVIHLQKKKNFSAKVFSTSITAKDPLYYKCKRRVTSASQSPQPLSTHFCCSRQLPPFPDLLHPPCNFTCFCSYPFAIVPFYTTYSAHTLSHPTHSTLVSNTVPLPLPPAPSSVPLKTNITSLSKEASMWSLWVLSMNSFSVSAWGCGMKFNTEINNTTNKR